MDIKSLINKVITSKGILRIPSWWMRKLLTEIVGYIDSGDSANSKSIDSTNTEISHIKNLSLPYMLVSGTGIVNIDEKEVSFTDANKQLIYITGAITFKKQDHTPNNLITYIYIPHIDIRSQGRDMSYMFYECRTLTSLDLSSFNTSAVTNMSSMFSSCSALTSLNLSSFDTSAVTNMSSMFYFCSGLTSFDLSSFDTSAVTNMSGMFYYCSALTSLDLSSFNTSAVTNMSSMFSSCSALTSLNLSGFDTSAVTDMYSMFFECRALTSLNLSGFDTSSVTSMAFMFYSCSGLTSLDLSSFNTSAVTNMSSMFYYCRALTSLNLSSFDTSAVTNMSGMFSECSALTSLILGPNFFKTSKVTIINLSYCSNWTNDTVVTSLATNSYNRASAGLSSMTLKLSVKTKAALTKEQKAAITSKGYTIA